MRKLAAIMFTDIVGYSALMSKSESLAMEVLEKNRSICKTALKAYNGEFIKEIGDGTLCIFQSSWDAVNCAIAIQRSVAAEKSFLLRIGIHIGDIVITDNDVFGDSVNIASRIESICEPGGIYITQRVYEDIQNKLDCRTIPLGEKSLKNIAHPLFVYAIPPSEMNKDLAKSKAARHPFPVPSKSILIIAGILTVLAAVFFTFRPLVLKALVSSDPIPIAVISFENQTGETKFDYLQKAIPNLLITNLEQSNQFRVLTWERMQDLLQQMGKSDVKHIDPALGFEICRREGCNLIVIGSYVKAGETFVTDVKVLDVQTKQIIKSVSTRGKGEESILQAQIDDLSKEISGSAGIPSYRFKPSELHVSDVTTSSINAYDFYLKGREALDKMYYNDAREYFETALELDSTFAVAWLYLSNAYNSLQNSGKMYPAIENAYRHSARATEKEQMLIRAGYARIVENDPEKELRIMQELSSKFPREKYVHYTIGVWYCNHGMPDDAIAALNKALDLDPGYSEALNQIAYQYLRKGMNDEALRYFRRYASSCPNDANPHDSMGDLFWQLGKLDDAISEYTQALAIKRDFHISAGKIAYIHAMKEDYGQAHKWLDNAISIAPTPGTQAMWHWVKAWMYNWCGERNRALASLDKTRKLAEEENNQYIIAGTMWMTAFMNLDEKAFDSAEVNFSKAIDIFLEFTTDPAGDSVSYFLFNATLNMAKVNLSEAEYSLGQVQRLMPLADSSSLGFTKYWNACNRVELLLAGNLNQQALEEGKKIDLPELPAFEFPQVLIYNIPFHHDFVARACLRLGMKAEAIAEYENLVSSDPENPDRRLVHPIYHYRLGKLYEEKGDNAKAAEQYRILSDIWKDADEKNTAKTEIKARLSSLKNTRSGI